MNELRDAISPYLRQHAHQPVHWQCWNEHTLAQARQEDKPIILSIGYSTCHWCHVMARESFEDTAVAEFMNQHFICIKIDREERPDLDRHFMRACEALTGDGGWPLHVFLTPGQRPFYAGTYFPPQANAKRAGWMDTLQLVAYNFYQNRRTVENEADRTATKMVRLQAAPAQTAEQQAANSQSLAAGLQRHFDTLHGGFGQGSKFPNTMALEWLLHQAWYHSDLSSYQHLHHSLERMLQGSLHDPVGGGFARYTVDHEWRVPHFEKMLYDNALMASLLSKLQRWQPRQAYLQAIRSALGFLKRELKAPNGLFYAALSAETAGIEGAFYTWTYDELTALLPREPYWFFEYYHITQEGNWDNRNILYANQSVSSFANRLGLSEATVQAYLDSCKAKLFRLREQRPCPARDEQLLTAWNALTASAFLEAYLVTQQPADLQTGLAILQQLEQTQTDSEGLLLHQQGSAHHAYLDGYAYYIQALLLAHKVTQDTRWLEKARTATEQTYNLFQKRQSPLLSFAPKTLQDAPDLAFEVSEEDTPAPNAVMAMNLQQLGLLLHRPEWTARSSSMIAAVRTRLQEHPLTHATWGQALLAQEQGWLELAVVGPEAPAQSHAINQQYWGYYILMSTDTPTGAYPLLAHRGEEARTPIYVCRNYQCQRPVYKVRDIDLVVKH
ncbi:thioredoxin domain-containing protein [Phaeodactylibacter xiamenensis]|uniref:thioredoxin domain-containing protein n=1 Tax=Phaeodactylibacter xiamenensis TaxID=1524460 RepID=UPI003CCC09EB